MKLSYRTLLYLLVGSCILKSYSTSGAEREPIEFQGRITAVDVGAKTISVRARTKEFVFNVDSERCNITKDGVPSSALKSAQVDDYVVGILTVDGPSPVVTRLCLTTKPELAVRVPDKPGFVTSPYQPTGHTTAIDVRGYQRGSMLVDRDAGKIFLIP